MKRFSRHEMQLIFYKYQGTGNDFVVFDNREGNIELTPKEVRWLCDRKFGIGGDGLMLLGNMLGYDFSMTYYNSDGKEGSMCGNGGRCLVQFAKDLGILKEKYLFSATDGPHEAYFSEGWVCLKMNDVKSVGVYRGDLVLDTGSPHYVKYVTDVMSVDVDTLGKSIRNQKEYSEKGINVNFVETTDEDKIFVRTFERGVEKETLSCGTGVTAAALVSAHNESGYNRIEVKTLGGNLAVEYEKTGEQTFSDIWLCGPATFVFKGTVTIGADEKLIERVLFQGSVSL